MGAVLHGCGTFVDCRAGIILKILHVYPTPLAIDLRATRPCASDSLCLSSSRNTANASRSLRLHPALASEGGTSGGPHLRS